MTNIEDLTTEAKFSKASSLANELIGRLGTMPGTESVFPLAMLLADLIDSLAEENWTEEEY